MTTIDDLGALPPVRIHPLAWIPLHAALALLLGIVAARVGSAHGTGALVICLVPIAPVLIVRPRLAVVLALACLPYEIDLAAGAVGGLNVAASDLLFAAAFVGLIIAVRTDPNVRKRLAMLRPLAAPGLVYLGAALLSFATHPSRNGLVALTQRVEVVVLPILAGALLLDRRTARLGLGLFTAAALALGIAWLLPQGNVDSVLGVQKNPAGQYIADAALVALVFVPKVAVRVPLFVVLVVGTYATQSRGALFGLGAGLVVYALMRSKDPVQFLLRMVPLAGLLLLVYSALPHAEQQRVLGQTKQTHFNDLVRQEYARDADKIISAHPIVGIGVGNYLAGDPAKLTQTDDPHNVVLLETAEGGAVLITAFAILQLGAVVVVFRRRRDNPWAIAAISVQVAIVVHALVDVYWVRGTPVLGWLLIGLALANVRPRSLEPRPSRARVLVGQRA